MNALRQIPASILAAARRLDQCDGSNLEQVYCNEGDSACLRFPELWARARYQADVAQVADAIRRLYGAGAR